MNEPDLERQLRNHYRPIDDAVPPYRAAVRVAHALDRERARRSSIRLLLRGRAVLVAGLELAMVAVLAIALLPLWRGTNEIALLPVGSPNPGQTPGQIAPNQPVQLAGTTRGGILWAVSGADLLTSSDQGRTWKNSGLPDTATCSTTVVVWDGQHAWCLSLTDGGAVASVVRTSDGGLTWEISRLPGTFALTDSFQLSFVDREVGFAFVAGESGGSGQVLRTEDGGLTWSVTGSTGTTSVTAVDAETLWAATNPNSGVSDATVLEVSRDAGANWTPVKIPDSPAATQTPGSGTDPNQCSAIHGYYVNAGPGRGPVTFLSQDEGFAEVFEQDGYSMAACYLGTENGGRTWSVLSGWSLQTQSIHYPNPPGATDFIDARHWFQPGLVGIYQVGMVGLSVTSDAGANWATVSVLGPDYLPIAELLMTDTQNGAALVSLGTAGHYAMYLTHDSGKTWQLADFSAH
jgi:photosystem II stability/assembly factor-like uncharacterized protein